MSSQIITGLWSSNFLGNHSVTKIASQNTPVQMPLPSLRGSSLIGKRYILVLNQKGVTPPFPQRTVDSTVHVFLSYTMV